MKSAEEWSNKIDGCNVGCSVECCTEPSDYVETIKQIQLDAMKEGMRRAANEVMCTYADVQTSAPRLKRDLNQAILTAAEQLTEKDL